MTQLQNAHAAAPADAEASATPLAYYRASTVADVPLLRLILVAGIVVAALLVLSYGAAWIFWTAQALTGQLSIPAGMEVHHAAQAIESASALMLLIGLVGCFRISNAMRRIALVGALALITAAFAQRVLYFVTIYLNFVGPSWLQGGITLLGELVEAGIEVAVPVMIWFTLRRREVVALFMEKS